MLFPYVLEFKDGNFTYPANKEPYLYSRDVNVVPQKQRRTKQEIVTANQISKTKETKSLIIDLRNNKGGTFAGIPLSKGIELVSELESIRNDNSPLAQWSLRWILDHPAISTVIPGASSPKQVISNTAASSMKPLELETHQRVRALYKTKVKQHIRGAY